MDNQTIKEDVVSGLTNMLYKSAGVANPLDSLDQTRIGPKAYLVSLHLATTL